MGASLKLGKILGVPVSLHFSWFIVFFVFAFLLENYFGRDRSFSSWSAEERWALALGTSLMLFVTVLAHELSHSLVAMRRGVKVHGITLFVLGGVSHLARESPRPSTDFMVALVGPLSSILLGLIFVGLGVALEGVSQPLSVSAWILGFANIVMVGAFNLLPCFPMDGGRMLRAVTWGITGNYWSATRMATVGGQLIAASMIVGGIALAVLGSGGFRWFWLVAMGIFLQVAASATFRQLRQREALRDYTARDLMATGWPVVPKEATLDRLVEDHIGRSGGDFAVVTWAGSPQGVVTRGAIDRVPKARWAETTMGSLMEPLSKLVSVGPEEAANDVMDLLDGDGVEAVAVSEGTSLLGLIVRDNMRRFAKAHAAAGA